jgi:MinD superfamily P-loop ATPase
VRVAVASGKGGTGKTLVSTSLAWMLAEAGGDVAYVDADVEAPNGHLFLRPTTSTERFAVPLPTLAGDRCSGCGRCQEFCASNAIVVVGHRVLVFEELCHSCGGCLIVCPDKALVEIPREVGTVEVGRARAGQRRLDFAAGTLDVGIARATPLIEAVLRDAPDRQTVLIDAAPGTSCPAVAAVRAADRVLLVTEPTPFGLHDLKLAVQMCHLLGRDAGVVINRSDLGDGRVRAWLEQEGLPILAEIPFLSEVAQGYARGQVGPVASRLLAHLLEPVIAWVEERS